MKLSSVKSSEMWPVYFPQQLLLAGGPPSFDAICREEAKQRNLNVCPAQKKTDFVTEADLKRLIKSSRF